MISPFAVFPPNYSASSVISDEAAAERVERHFANPHSSPDRPQAERELIRLILSSPLEERRLPDVLRYANIVFFEGLLTPPNLWPLRWRPSSEDSSDIIGTTELRQTRTGRFETRITLSTSILHNAAYDQRLVLSAVLHEAIHAYLFIRRGFAATTDGGHSKGFRRIARLIDRWIGDDGYLQLHCTEAILKKFQTRSKCGWRRDTSTWGAEEHGFTWIRWDYSKRDNNVGHCG
ncbi:MAG: hypothetical protein M1816_005682 [Peltula sp. TS41687]|nr:MAG: hypothetical protein M1816_005682 [Peltula sp. TS41687]